MKRETLTSYGPKRGGVRVIRERGLILVAYYNAEGLRKYKSFAKVADAKLWAETHWNVRLERTRPTAVTVNALWERYKAAEFHNLRPRTRQNYSDRFRWWSDFLTPTASAESVTLERIGQFRKEQKEAGRAVNQVRGIIRTAKIVWNWGELAGLIERNPLGRYRFKLGKGEKVNRPDAYEEADLADMLATLDPRNPYQWRPWVLMTLLGNQGVRANAALHLRWSDVDFDGNGLTWWDEHDKMGREWWQPLLQPTREALLVALGYSKGSPWVFPSPKRKKGPGAVYTIQALTEAIHTAEDRAGVQHRDLRACHGFRRLVVNRVRRLVDDPAAALRFVGDTDIRQAVSYVRVRNDELAGIAALLDTENANPLPKATATHAR